MDVPGLGTLRHRWVWTPRNIPHVPVLSKVKVPSTKYRDEENARMINVYMRPWVIPERFMNKDEVTAPTLTMLEHSHTHGRKPTELRTYESMEVPRKRRRLSRKQAAKPVESVDQRRDRRH